MTRQDVQDDSTHFDCESSRFIGNSRGPAHARSRNGTLSKERVGCHPDAPDFEGHAAGMANEEITVGGPVAPSYQPITQKPVASAA